MTLRPPCPSEHAEQAAYFRWIEMQPDKMLRRLAWANINGAKLPYTKNAKGQRICRQAQILKSEGLRPGIPDVTIAIPAGTYHGLYLEFKRIEGGKVSKDQREIHDLLIAQGYKVFVVKGWEAAVAATKDYLGME